MLGGVTWKMDKLDKKYVQREVPVVGCVHSSKADGGVDE